MNYLSKDTQVTPTGLAIKHNNLASSALSQMFASNIGPSGTLKLLISPSTDLSLTKDGALLCRDIQFTHPLSKIITNSAINLSQTVGDGTSTFIVLACELFTSAYKYYQDGASIHKTCSGMQRCMQDILVYLGSIKKKAQEDTLYKAIYTSLSTKIDLNMALSISKFVEQAVNAVRGNAMLDLNMIEVLKMGEGDPEESLFVDGLVLDHGNRHPLMPTLLDDVYVLTASISLEYEKPEVNATFHYKTAEQRESLVRSEGQFIKERTMAIVNFGKEVRKRGKSLVLINEKGIGPEYLEMLAEGNILALRRAKRRNLERLLLMCGGNLVSRSDQLLVDNLGYCKRVRVLSLGDDKYTFMEGTPLKGSCTILVRGNTREEMNRITEAIKSSFRSVVHLLRDDVYLEGGMFLYQNLYAFLTKRINEVKNEDVIGYKVVKDAILNICKVLMRNANISVEENVVRMERGEFEDEGVIDNYCVVTRIIGNACILAVNLLMFDDIIKAGKPLKEETQEEQ